MCGILVSELLIEEGKMPRVSIRRMLVYVAYTLVVTSLVMLALHVQQQNPLWLRLAEQSADGSSQGNSNNNGNGNGNGIYEQGNSKELPESDQDPNAVDFESESLNNTIESSGGRSSGALRRHGLPWYIKDDGHRPDEPMTNIWPTRNNGDRIEEQLMIRPRYVNDPASLDDAPLKRNTPLKKIFLPNGFNSWQVKGGQRLFLDQKCPVDRCALTAKRDEAPTADAILYKGKYNILSTSFLLL